MEIIATIRCSQTHSQQTRVSFPYINIHPGNMPRDDDNNNNSTTVGITKHIGCYLNILMYKTVCVCVYICTCARAFIGDYIAMMYLLHVFNENTFEGKRVINESV
jgi:hypothetical protein